MNVVFIAQSNFVIAIHSSRSRVTAVNSYSYELVVIKPGDNIFFKSAPPGYLVCKFILQLATSAEFTRLLLKTWPLRLMLRACH